MSSRIPYEQAETLIEKFRVAYQNKYDEPPSFNVISAKYDLADIIRDVGYNETRKLFAFFFRTQGSHELQRFLRSYHELYAMMKLQRADAVRRKELRNKVLD